MTSEEGQLTSIDQLQRLLESTLPQDEIVYAFGYGSGVLSQNLQNKQTDQQKSDNMIDIIVVVKDSLAFHKANLEQNPHHYEPPFFWQSSSVQARADSANRWQRHDVLSPLSSFFCNPKVYFNIVPEEGLKYGVVKAMDLADDLQDWKYLYLAGRMHKPTVEIIQRPMANQPDIRQLQHSHNLPAALSTALLLSNVSTGSSPMSLSSAEIYTNIAALSYTGDFRMAAGAEDPQKITKLVSSPGQMERFDKLYQEAADRLQQAGILSINKTNNVWTWDASSATAKQHLWSSIPVSVQLKSGYSDDPSSASSTTLQAALLSIVAPAARYQSLKGLATAGFAKSAAYAARKLSKGLFRSR